MFPIPLKLPYFANAYSIHSLQGFAIFSPSSVDCTIAFHFASDRRVDSSIISKDVLKNETAPYS